MISAILQELTESLFAFGNVLLLAIGVSALALIAIAFVIAVINKTLRLFKVMGYVKDFIWHREEFKEWLKERKSCKSEVDNG